MNHEKDKLIEKILIFLLLLSSYSKSVNINTFRRYIYLYYLTDSFLNGESENISINIDKGSINIINFDTIISNLSVREFVEISGNNIIIYDSLIEYVEHLLSNKNGEFYSVYRQVKPFVNLLQSYDEQFVFTIFFSEPTFIEATQRGLTKLNSNNSKLAELLEEFKKKINNERVDEYDILTYWMDYILKNYYTSGRAEHNVEK